MSLLVLQPAVHRFFRALLQSKQGFCLSFPLRSFGPTALPPRTATTYVSRPPKHMLVAIAATLAVLLYNRLTPTYECSY